MKATFKKHTFYFKNPSGTSRGVLTEKHSWFIELVDESDLSIKGIGECSIIPGLSPDFIDFESYEMKLKEVCQSVDYFLFDFNLLVDYPSILFGLETAFFDLKNGGKGIIFDNSFSRGERRIPINGLIWMGDENFMLHQIEQKLDEGYSCLKMKIGAIDFDSEMKIIEGIRKRYSSNEISLRVDANGAFSPIEALEKLNILSEYEIHSIEQPIRQGQWEEMKDLCSVTKVPIALDEELISVNLLEEKKNLLQTILPQFIILKPSLHGGIKGCKEWIEIAESLVIPWWITSALESNIGLNAVAQFTAEFQNNLPQGLGTGSLYTNNVNSNLKIENGFIFSEN
jgi:o-succinylbenzoate synthase